jgi:hypothetical protein
MTDTNAAAVVEGQFADAEPLTDAQKIQAAVEKAKAEQDAADDAKRATRKGRRVGRAEPIDHPTYEESVEARKPDAKKLDVILEKQRTLVQPEGTEREATKLAPYFEYMAYAIAAAVTKWSLVDDAGQPIPITPETVGGLEYDFVQGLYDELNKRGFFG